LDTVKDAWKTVEAHSKWSNTGQRWLRIGLLSVGAVASLQCGNEKSSPVTSAAGMLIDAGNAGAAGSALNECRGELPLRFASKAARVGDRCGECDDGKLACGAPNVLVCLGAHAAQPNCSGAVDHGAPNPCGGFGELQFEGQPATPGGSCSRCGDGALICTSPTQLGCYGGQAKDCADGGASGSDGGAGSAGSGGDALGGGGTSGSGAASGQSGAGSAGALSGGTGGSAGSSGSAGTGGSAGNCNTYLGHSAAVGDACGACDDGKLICPGSASKTLYCNGATPTGYCNDPSAAPNTCGGLGPMLWRGTPASPSVPCGGCGYGQLGCATKTQLTCSAQSIQFSNAKCDNPPEYSTCTIPPSAYGATPLHTAPAPLPDTKPTVSSFQSINLTVNAIAYNAFDRRLYATVPGSDGPNGNSLAVIDPAAQTVLQYVPVGSEPNGLAISDDGKVLWVANAGSNTLRRVDLTTLTTGPLLPLGDDDYGKVARHLSILPGTQDSVVVASNGLTIFDNGVPRAMAATTYGLLTSPTYSPFLLYGYNNDDTGYDFVTFCVNQYGISVQRSQQNLLSGFGPNFQFDAGVLYGSSGAYDINKQSVVGSYPVADAVAIDPANRRIFTLRRFPNTQLAAYDMDTFGSVGNDAAFPAIKSDHPQLVRWGRYGLAFADGADLFGPLRLYVGKSTLVP